MGSRSGIFISYRRSDAAGHAGRLFDWMLARGRPGGVFTDVSAIAPGGDFANAIDAALARCEFMLVVIGRDWAAALEARSGDANDWVRIEIEHALKAGLRIVPVLVGGATLPAASQLPRSLKPLRRLQAIELSDSKWESDRELLWRALKPARRWSLPQLTISAWRTSARIGIVALLAAGGVFLASLDRKQPERDAPIDIWPMPGTTVDPVQVARIHSSSPLVVRSLLAILRERKVPEPQWPTALEQAMRRYQDIERNIFRNKTHLEGEGYRRVVRAGSALDAFDKAWEAALRLYREGRLAESASTVAMAVDQLASRRSPQMLDRDTSHDVALGHWLLGEIDRLMLLPSQAAVEYAAAQSFQVLKAGSHWRLLSFRIIRSWAQLLTEQGDFDAAEAKFRDGLRLAEQAGDDGLLIEMLGSVATTLERRRRDADAAPLRSRALEVQLRSSNAGDSSTQDRAREYAATLTRLGRAEESRAVLDRFGLGTGKP